MLVASARILPFLVFIPVTGVFQLVGNIRGCFGYAGNAAAQPQEKFGKFKPGQTLGRHQRKFCQLFQIGALRADGMNHDFFVFLGVAAFLGNDFPVVIGRLAVGNQKYPRPL